jgi:hypothetical protein
MRNLDEGILHTFLDVLAENHKTWQMVPVIGQQDYKKQ